jgi:hypothetical protein
MSTITDLISHTAQRYAKAMAIIHAHQGNINAGEALVETLVETLNEIADLNLSLSVITAEHYDNLPAEDPQSIAIIVFAQEYNEAALRRAILGADLHIASETEQINHLGEPRTILTLSDIDGIEIRIQRQALREAA